MKTYASATQFLEHMSEVAFYTRDGYFGISVDYSQFDTGESASTRDYAAEKFTGIRKLLWFENVLKVAFEYAPEKDVMLWWLLKAMRMSRTKIVDAGLSPYGRRFLKSATAERKLDAMDQRLVDELSRRGLISYNIGVRGGDPVK